VLLLKQQIKELEEDLGKEVRTHQATSPELSDLERQLAALQVHLDGVNKDISKYSSLIKTLPVKSSEEGKLRLALTASQDIYSSLLDYSNRIGVAEAMTLPDAMVVQPAIRPYEPKSPKLILNGIIGAFLGLFFAFGLAFLAEYIDDTLKTPEDIEQYKELVFLGSIPRIRKPKLIAEIDVNDPVSEAYRTIRNGMKYSSLDKPIKTFLVTSSGPKEGKTLTVANLGISFSQTGSKVLLVDTDLRRPSLHELFGELNQTGLTHVVTGESGWEAIENTGINNLSLLPSGPTPLDPGKIFESERLKELIGELSSRFDLIILDSAPLLIKSDATVLGRYVDGVIYTLEAGKTTRKAVTETLEILKKANVRLLGAVLNKYGKKKAYYRYPSEKKKRSIFRKIFFVTLLTVMITGIGCSKSSNPYLNPNIKEYLKDIKSSNIPIQRNAINKLGLLQIKDAVPEMIRLLPQSPAEVKPDIVEALGNIGDKAALDPLIAMLDNENILVREKAIEALGKIGDKRAVPVLTSILEQKDNKTEGEVFTAIWALGNIGDKSAEPVLNSLLGDRNKYVRYNAEQALKKIRTTTTAKSVETTPSPVKDKIPKSEQPSERDKETLPKREKPQEKPQAAPESKSPDKTNSEKLKGGSSNNMQRWFTGEIKTYVFPSVFKVKNDLAREVVYWLKKLGYPVHVSKIDIPEKRFCTSPKNIFQQNRSVQAQIGIQKRALDNPVQDPRGSYRDRVSPSSSHQTQVVNYVPPEPIENKIYNLEELPSSIKQNLPTIAISVFVYSDDASSRMARINGQMMREGEYITADLKLEKITLDGPVFRFQNYCFSVKHR
jgi:capsular exopolysaccharide synthesis family protein